jgi:hypothetical protein
VLVIGVSATCNNELYLHLYMEHADATFNAVECLLIFSAVFRSVATQYTKYLRKHPGTGQNNGNAT